MSLPGTITIQESHQEEVAADHARLHLKIEGTSLVSGTAALKRAQEVANFVELIREMGLDEKCVRVMEVTATVAEGFLTKSSSATYVLEMELNDLSRLPDLLVILPTMKSVQLQGIEWAYRKQPEILSGWLRSLLERATAKAKLVADGLGVKLDGVHRFRERVLDPETREVAMTMMMGAGAAPPAVRRRAEPISPAFPISHLKLLGLQIRVDYRVAAPAGSSI